MPICSFANLLFAAGVLIISPVYLPSRDGTTRALLLVAAVRAGVAADVAAGTLDALDGADSPLLRPAVEHPVQTNAIEARVAIRFIVVLIMRPLWLAAATLPVQIIGPTQSVV